MNTSTHDTTPLRWRRLGVQGLLWLFLCSIPVPAYSASGNVCMRWYKKKRYLNASRCYLGVYLQLKKKEKRTDEEKEKMGASLRNVGLILRKAADAEKHVARAAYLRERAAHYLTLFLNGKHYHSPTQRNYTISQRDSLKEKIGYAKLTVLAHPKAQLQISGYKYTMQGKGSWSGRVRPGHYAILARRGGRTEAKEVNIPPNQPKVVRITSARTATARRPVPIARAAGVVSRKRPAPIQRRASPNVRPGARRLLVRVAPPLRPKAPSSRRSYLLPGLVLGVGVAVAATGGVLTALAFATRGSRDAQIEQIRQKQQHLRTYEDTLSTQSLHADANTQLMVGIIAGGVGVAILGVGVVLFALPEKQPLLPKASTTP